MSGRFYREAEPIGIGSIVIRYSFDGTGIKIGQIVGEDESLRSNARWLVFSDGITSRWHSATILRTLKDWEEAAFVKGAVAARALSTGGQAGGSGARSSVPGEHPPSGA